MPKTDKAPKPKTPKKKLLHPLETISVRTIAAVAAAIATQRPKQMAALLRQVPRNAEGLEAFVTKALGTALTLGEITIPDGTDIPAKLRKANLARIQKIRDPKVRAEFLAGKGTPKAHKPAATPAKSAA